MYPFALTNFLFGSGIVLGVLALMILPFVIGGYLMRKLRMPDHGWKLGLILWCLAVGVAVIAVGGRPKLGIDLSGGVILVYEVDPEKKIDAEPVDMDKLIAAVSRRVNPGGVKEVTIRPYGAEQIEIIIPEVGPEEARRIEKHVSRAGTLEFRILASQYDDKSLIDQARRESGKVLKDRSGNVSGRWVEVQGGDTPQDIDRVSGLLGYGEIAQRTVKRGEREVTEILVVQDTFDVTGAYLLRAQSNVDQKGQPCVSFTFNAKGGRLFAGLTGDNVPDPAQPNRTRKLGIVLDGYLYSAPSIRETIHERGEITGSFTKEEVQDQVGVLNAGSLPTALSEEPISRMQIGPTLGQDTIDKGSVAIGVSMVLVLVFMLFYYRFAGVIACGALLMNLLLILAIMISIKAAFTLPGLAGLVLTVGIAVDANVLVFERIREELVRGAALRMAIRNGFGKATSTIVDANMTTLITGVILYWVGTDQVKGFAVTLILGVTLSMFTAIFCSRVIFDIAEKQRWITRLRMMRIVGRTQIDFLGMRRLAVIASSVVIAVGLTGVVLRGAGLLDIDFTGGVSIQVEFKPEKPQTVAALRKSLDASLNDLAVSDVQIGDEALGVRFLINTSNRDVGEVKQVIHDAFGDNLATNAVDFPDPALIEAAAVEVEEAASPESTEPDKTDQSRDDLPNDSVLAMAGTAPILLAQAGESSDAEPSGDEEAAAAPEAEDSGEGPPAETPAETPAQAPAEAVDSTFVGGTLVQLTFANAVSYESLMDMFLAEFGSENAVPTLELSSPDPAYEEEDDQAYAVWDVKIKLPPEEAVSKLESIRATVADTPSFPSSNTIGGKVAGSMQKAAIAAFAMSLICIVGYIWIRFQRVIFGLAAVIALVHDVLITLGVVALSAYVAPYLGFLLIDPFKIGLPALAAFLTIMGYSLNDTIVVFDRIREVRGKAPRLTEEMINTSINQTLARTLLTSLTTLIVVLILYTFGGQGIHGFAFALVVGVLVGTYSSIFVASPALLWMSRPSQASSPSGKLR